MIEINYRNRAFRFILLTVFFLILSVGCCAVPTVYLGPPHDRFDHNRTLVINNWEYEKWIHCDEPHWMTIELDRLNRNEVYTPQGHNAAPSSLLKGKDGLPAAHLVPVYTGVALPLSDDESSSELSDRQDLLDYLGQGGLAHHGIEAPSMAAALGQETEKKFLCMLELLSSKEKLSSRAEVLDWAKNHGLETTFNIVDARYRALSFSDRIAIKNHDFWFVLFRLPDAKVYTRLVVVPGRQDEERVKKPVKGGE